MYTYTHILWRVCVWNTLIIHSKHQSWYVQRSSSHRQMVTAHFFVIFLSIVKVWLCENYNWDSFLCMGFWFVIDCFCIQLSLLCFSIVLCISYFVRVSNVFSIWFNIVEPFVIILIFVCSKVCQYCVWNIVCCVCVYVKEINTQFNIGQWAHSHTVFIIGLLIPLRNCLLEARQGCFTVMSIYGHFSVSFIFIYWMKYKAALHLFNSFDGWQNEMLFRTKS